MEILVLVEGSSDCGVVETFAKKLGRGIEVRVMRGNRKEKIIRLIKTYKDYDKAIVLKDLHTSKEENIKRILNEIKKNTSELGIKVHGIIVRRAIEAWILSDPESLSRYLNINISIGDSEDIIDPANLLDNYLKRINRRYVKNREIAKQLAELVNLNKATMRSRSLKEFIDILKDP